MELYIVEDGIYKLVVQANSWEDAKAKAHTYAFEVGISLDITQLDVSICYNSEVIK